MIKLRSMDLSEEAGLVLAQLQMEIDRLPTYKDRVNAAIKQWEAKRRTAVFRMVTETLDAMCAGRRCMFCEDNSAHEVEHFCPKSIYPGLVFAWMNFLYACGPCNRSKGQRFAIVSPKTGTPIEIKPSDNEPEDGDHVLLDPRRDDPMAYMRLELRDPFFFHPKEPRGTIRWSRADYTIRWLGLNERDALVEARSSAYDDYRARLAEYVEKKRSLAGQEKLNRLKWSIQRKNHVTVWREMQQQYSQIDELRHLFEEASEALEW